MNIPSITVSDDRSQIVDIRSGLALVRSHLASGIPMLAVVHGLGLEQPLHLVRDGVIRVVTKVGGHFVGGGQKGGASPTRNIQDLLVRSLLGHLDRVNSTHLKLLASCQHVTADSVRTHLYEPAVPPPPSHSTN